MKEIPIGLSFKTTDELMCLNEIIGQNRAKQAMEFALSVETEGYNIYISGEPGTGKAGFAKGYAQKVADQKPVPSDWSYVYNFREKATPKVLRFDAGDGKIFENDMIELIEYLTAEIPYLYTADAYDEDLKYEMGLHKVGYHIKALKEKYQRYKEVLSYLDDLQRDILDNLDAFIKQEDLEELVSKYDVNLLVDHSKSVGAPVVAASNLSPHNLLALFHQANGGYLILDAEDVLADDQLWKAIKHMLVVRRLTDGIPLSVKIILTGNLDTYHLLYKNDSAFSKYFKARVDFDSEIDNTQANQTLIARFIKTFADQHMLLPLSFEAVKEVIRLAIRYTENQKKITAELSKVGDIIIESNAFAGLEGARLVERRHVEQAVDQRKHRVGPNDHPMIETIGEKIGQTNTLMIGTLAKVTATSYQGEPGLIKIEGGKQEIVGYLGQKYAQEFPIPLTCRVCLEANHGVIDGEGTCSAQLYSIISSLSGIPIKQNLAALGSVNQLGIIGPVCKVTHKIEGFYAICKNRGLTGDQGVIISVSNRDNLVFSNDLLEAIRAGSFHIYTISTIEEGLAILTGKPYQQIETQVSRKLAGFSQLSKRT